MEPRIELLQEKKLLGAKMKMSLTRNLTGVLWGGFARGMGQVPNRVNEDKISMQVYPTQYHSNFNPENEFEKWATVEVKDFSDVPEGLFTFTLKGGLYAIFDYVGSSSDSRIFEYIFRTWLPNSAYELEHRPHFEVLGAKYKNNDPSSEEEIWIPVKKKATKS